MNPHCKDGFYSEYGEDRWIAENLTLPRDGVYVDLGAAHPHYASNTAFLRDRGWWGLSIDGNEEWRSCYQTGFFRAIISPHPKVWFKENGLMSRIGAEGEERTALPLQPILDGFGIGDIDYLSVDLEGAEFDAFQTFDLAKVRPKIIVAEYSTAGIGEDFRLRDYLLARGYKVVHQTVANLIYIPA